MKLSSLLEEKKLPNGLPSMAYNNMTCDYCPVSLDELNHLKNGISFISKEVFKKIVDYLHNLPNLQYVALTDFNEFFQTPELTTFFLPELKKRGLPYVINSNGSVKPKHIEYYKDHQPKYLILGVQTITEEHYYSNNRLDSLSWKEYVQRVANIVKFFYENCPETLISVEVAANHTINLWRKLTHSVENKNIPSEAEQMNYLSSFVNKLTELTNIDFDLSTNSKGRYGFQKVIAGTHDNRIIFGLKSFEDITTFYDNIPVNHDPVCYADAITFDTNGKVKMCCIDFRNTTEFANANQESMPVIFQRYLNNVDEMRSTGSPFSGCRNCKGFKSKSEKLFSLRKNYYPKLAKKIPAIRTLRNKLKTL